MSHLAVPNDGRKIRDEASLEKTKAFDLQHLDDEPLGM